MTACCLWPVLVFCCCCFAVVFFTLCACCGYGAVLQCTVQSESNGSMMLTQPRPLHSSICTAVLSLLTPSPSLIQCTTSHSTGGERKDIHMQATALRPSQFGCTMTHPAMSTQSLLYTVYYYVNLKFAFPFNYSFSHVSVGMHIKLLQQ